MLIRQPTAGCFEIEIQMPHHQIYRSAGGPANETSEGILAHPERKARVAVLMERAEALVHLHVESKSLCDPLDGEVAELLKL